VNHYEYIDRTSKIIEEVLVRTLVDKIDTEALFETLQDELIKYRNELLTYGHSIGYNEGYDEGYAAGYKRGVNDTIGEVQN
jgi:flagellar biosynthesis/type III secretory pathway protein FliH